MTTMSRRLRFRYWLSRFRYRLRRVEWLTARKAGVVLTAFAVGMLVRGPFVQHGQWALQQFFTDVWSNLGTELLSIAITVLFIDTLNQRRQRKERGAQLVPHLTQRHCERSEAISFLAQRLLRREPRRKRAGQADAPRNDTRHA